MNTPTHIVLALATLAVTKERLPTADLDDQSANIDAKNINAKNIDDAKPNQQIDPVQQAKRRLIPARLLWAATIGGFLPDAPLFVFYAYEKGIAGSSERLIWSSLYFAPHWQDFFDFFNSIPVFAVLLGLAIRLGRATWAVLCGAVLLHLFCDLPVHHDDGHRHFWPLLDWRFASPISYWDPAHHGVLASAVEYLLFAVGMTVIWRAHQGSMARTLIGALAVIHTLMMVGIWTYYYSIL